MGIGTGAASANVFCKTYGFYKCPAGNYYQVGDKLQLGSQGVQVRVAGYQELFCSQSELEMTITNAGGSTSAQPVRTRIDNYTLQNCTKTPTVLGTGNSYTTWDGGTFDGRTYLPELSFKSFSSMFGTNCTYTFTDPGVLHHPGTLSGTSESYIEFNKTPMSSKICNPATFTGTYVFYEPNQRIFVLQE